MNGFFSTSTISSKKISIPLLARCGSCGLFKDCQSPKMPYSGEGKKGILIVGESPGGMEDIEGIQFVGESGQLLQDTLEEVGIDMRKDCWITNAVICHPEKNILPKKAVEYCRPNLVRTIKELNPSTIILLGGSAIKSLMGWIWKEDVGEVGKWVGWKIPCQSLNTWICPTWHPSYLLRGAGGKDNKVLDVLFTRHLKEATELVGRPWKRTPDWKSKVEVIIDPNKVFDASFGLFSDNPVAFDFETDRLKPDCKEASIVSCSFSNGQKTIAFPWTGSAIKVTKDLLISDTPKLGFNIKFENRWAKRFDIKIKNWKWDGMLAAHAIDNRASIKSLKFQSFINLGMESYDQDIKPYLESKEGSNSQNRIREFPLPKMLLYNGLDSLLTYKLAMKQMKILGVS